jgi:hypothetical protein
MVQHHAMIVSLASVVEKRQKVWDLSCKLLQNEERRWRSSIDARGRQLQSPTFFSSNSRLDSAVTPWNQ